MTNDDVIKTIRQASTYSSLEQVIQGHVMSPEIGTEYTVSLHFTNSRDAAKGRAAL